MEFVKNGFIAKSLKEHKTKQIDSICSEFIIRNRKWTFLSTYRLPNPNNMNTFFKIATNISKAAIKYENIIRMGIFTIDIKNKGSGCSKLDTCCDLFNLTNLIHSKT